MKIAFRVLACGAAALSILAQAAPPQDEMSDLVRRLREPGGGKWGSNDWNRLAAQGPRAVPVLRNLLRDPRLSFGALQTLVPMRHPGVTEAILEHLENAPAKDRKSHVLLAVGNHGDPRALPYVLPYAKSADSYERGAVAYALGRLGDPQGVSTLKLLQKDPSASVRWQAGQSLRYIEGMTAKYPDRLRLYDAPLTNWKRP